MAMTLHVDVVSAEESIFSGTAEFIAVPAEMGEVGVYPRHAPLLARIKPGSVRIKLANTNEPEQLIFVAGGYVEVQPHVVTILADRAVRSKDLDEARALEAKRAAENALRDRTSELEYATAQSQLAEAIAELQAIERLRKLRH